MIMARVGIVMVLADLANVCDLRFVNRKLMSPRLYRLYSEDDKAVYEELKGGTKHGRRIECRTPWYKYQYYRDGIMHLKVSGHEVIVQGVVHAEAGSVNRVVFSDILHIEVYGNTYMITDYNAVDVYSEFRRKDQTHISALELLNEVLELSIVKKLVLKI